MIRFISGNKTKQKQQQRLSFTDNNNEAKHSYRNKLTWIKAPSNMTGQRTWRSVNKQTNYEKQGRRYKNLKLQHSFSKF